MSSFRSYMRRSPSRMMTASSYAKAGSYGWTLGTAEASRCVWPSLCWSPSPFSVVRPAVAPIRKPRARASAKAQIWSIVRWKPNIE